MARLLVVDDEEKIRLIIRKYAEMEGHQVTEAKDGIEAVSICALEDFDVIILDVMMPGMDGFAVCKQVRRYKTSLLIRAPKRPKTIINKHYSPRNSSTVCFISSLSTTVL